MPDLARAITMNPGLHVLVQQGWYDLATPWLATKHDLEHLDITADARQRIRVEHYEAGHMMYLHAAVDEEVPRRSRPVHPGHGSAVVAGGRPPFAGGSYQPP